MSIRSRTPSPIESATSAEKPEEDVERPRARLRHNRRRVPVPDPMTVARNFDALTRGAATYRERKHRIAALAHDPQAMNAVPLDQIRQYLSRRQYEVAVLHLGQYRLPEIARSLGYASGKHVHAVLKTPAVTSMRPANPAAWRRETAMPSERLTSCSRWRARRRKPPNTYTSTSISPLLA